MSKRDEYLYLLDVLDSIEAIFEFVADINEDFFEQDRKTFSAVVRELEVIGEAISKISEETRAKYQEIPWREIKDFRNLLAHEYLSLIHI